MNFLNITGFEGIASANRLPSPNAANDIQNLDTRSVTNDLITINAYSGIMTTPAAATYRSRLTSPNFLAFTDLNFTLQTLTQETVVLVGNAVLNPENDSHQRYSGANLPANINIFTIFTNPYWTGTGWATQNTTSWNWLNETYLTRISAIDPSFTYRITIDGGGTGSFFDGQGVIGWTMVNLSTASANNKAVVMYSTPVTVSGLSQSQLYITYPAADWTVGDTILIMKNYVPATGPYINTLTGNFSATYQDITFHKVLGGLRIGFGGASGRLALSIVPETKFWGINEFDTAFPASDPVLSGIGLNTTLSGIANKNNLSLDPYNVIGLEATIKATQFPSGGSLTHGDYYMKMTAVLDNFQEFLVATSQIHINTDFTTLDAYPAVRFGTQNDRVTSFNIYLTTGISGLIGIDQPFYLFKQFNTFANTAGGQWVTGQDFMIDNQGAMTLKTSERITASGVSLDYSPKTDATVAPPTVGATHFDFNANAWTPGTGTTITVVPTGTFATADGGDYSLHLVPSAPNSAYAYFTFGSFIGGIQPTISLPADGTTTYHFIAYVYPVGTGAQVQLGVRSGPKIPPGGTGGQLGGGGTPTYPQQFWSQNCIPNAWNYIDVEITPDPAVLGSTQFIQAVIRVQPTSTNDIYIDRVSFSRIITNNVTAATSAEMTAQLGYQPTTDLSYSWDKALLIGGQTYALNTFQQTPTVGGPIKLVNKVLKSPISGAGAFLYDVLGPTTASTGGFLDLEAWDGNNVVNLELTQNGELFALRQNSIQQVDTQYGQARNIKLGDGLISKKGAFAIGDTLYFPGKYDVYAANGVSIQDLSQGTIRDRYRGFTDAQRAAIIGTGEKNSASYRFSVPIVGSGLEYILTPKGFITKDEISAAIQDYSLDVSGNVMWLDTTGNVYRDNLVASGINFKWRSTTFDNLLLGNSLPANTRFHIFELFFKYTASHAITANLYLHDVSTTVPQQTWTLPANAVGTTLTGANSVKLRTKLGMDSKKFSIELVNDNSGALNTVTISSAVISYKVAPTGLR